MKNQKVSTFTNLIYILLGLVVFVQMSVIVGLSLMFLGVCSFGYHYHNQKNRTWQKFDVYAMFAVFYSIMHYHLDSGVVEGIFLAIALGVVIWHERHFHSFLFLPVLFFLTSAIIFYQTTLWLHIPFFIVALLFNIRFMMKVEMDTLNDILHGCWHILTAFGFYMMIASKTIILF